LKSEKKSNCRTNMAVSPVLRLLHRWLQVICRTNRLYGSTASYVSVPLLLRLCASSHTTSRSVGYWAPHNFRSWRHQLDFQPLVIKPANCLPNIRLSEGPDMDMIAHCRAMAAWPWPGISFTCVVGTFRTWP